MAKKPHIVIFNPDQWRGDVLGHMGNSGAVTPHVDRSVAEDAVSFRHAFCQNTVCTPSRCSFLTGWYPHTMGHRTMHHMLRAHEPMLLKTLKQNGYFVWWGGKNDAIPGQHGWRGYADVYYKASSEDHARWGRPYNGRNLHGETEWRGDRNGDNWFSFYAGKITPRDGGPHYTDWDWQKVLGAIEQIKSHKGDQPLCIYLPITYPHPPYGVEEPYYSMIARARLPVRTPVPDDWSNKPMKLRGIWENQRLHGWTDARWTELRATYYGMCARVDHQWGMLVDALKDAGIYDDTAMFLFSDHGDYTGDFGIVEKTQNTFDDCLSRVPFVIKPPRDISVRARVSEALVELIDFPATVHAMAGIEPDYAHFGRSLVPLLTGQTDELRDAVFCEGGRMKGETHCMELPNNPTRDPDRLYSPRQLLQFTDEPMYHGKAVMCRTRTHKYVKRYYEPDEFYDLADDPRELRNRIADPTCADLVRRFRDRMLDWFLETGDTVPLHADARDFRTES